MRYICTELECKVILAQCGCEEVHCNFSTAILSHSTAILSHSIHILKARNSAKD